MSSTVLFTLPVEQNDHFLVFTETSMYAKISKTLLPEDVIDKFRKEPSETYYGKIVGFDTLVLLE